MKQELFKDFYIKVPLITDSIKIYQQQYAVDFSNEDTKKTLYLIFENFLYFGMLFTVSSKSQFLEFCCNF